MRRMDGGEALAQCAGFVEQTHGRALVVGQCGGVLRRLFGDMGVEDLPRRRGDDVRQFVASDSAHRVNGRADHGVLVTECVLAQLRVTPRPGVDGAVAEAPLLSAHRGVAIGVEASVEVTRVEQREPDAGLAGRLTQRRTHGVRVVVGRAVGAVVDVVELPHRRDAGQRHLGVHGARQCEVCRRIELRRNAVHTFTPRPERATVVMRAPAQCAVERMAVAVRETGQCDPVEPDHVVRGCVVRGHATRRPATRTASRRSTRQPISR